MDFLFMYISLLTLLFSPFFLTKWLCMFTFCLDNQDTEKNKNKTIQAMISNAISSSIIPIFFYDFSFSFLISKVEMYGEPRAEGRSASPAGKSLTPPPQNTEVSLQIPLTRPHRPTTSTTQTATLVLHIIPAGDATQHCRCWRRERRVFPGRRDPGDGLGDVQQSR